MRHRTARILMAPGLAGFSLFYLLPLGMTCFYAFVRSPFDATFVALDNLAKILMNSYFQMALQHTAFFTLISVGTVMLLSVFLTFFLANSSYKLHAPFMLPVLLPTVAVCLIWNVLFGRGSLLESLGIPVEASLYTLFLWKNTGLQVVFLLSALAQLPREPMEAAAIDGAGTLGRFWYVTLPQLFPTLLFCCFYVMMCSFRIFREAFSAKSVFGGLLGAAMMNGIKRGLYSNEAGIGSAPNAAASADVSHPAKQGLVQMLSVFIDTILICSSTAFMILCTNLDASAYVDAAGNTMNAAYIQDSLVANLGPAGSVFITVALTLFAFTTLVGNYFYAEMNISYLYPKATKNKPFMLFYRLLAAVIIFMGAQFSAGLAWDLADVLMGIMALINVPSCLIMGKTACKALVDYRNQKSEGKNPVFHAADIGLSGTDYWIETE